MMPEFDKNAAYIWACYGLGSLMIVATIIVTALRARAARKALNRMESLSE